MRYQGKVLSEDELQQIHEKSLQILSETGVLFHSKKARDLLKENGAIVDEETGIVKISEALVQKALASAPKKIILGGRDPEYDVEFPAAVPGCTGDGTGTYAVDFVTGEHRYAGLADIANAARVLNRMDTVTVFWPPVGASDAPSNSRVLHEAFTSLKYSRKHIQHELHRTAEIPYLIEGLKAVLGSEEAIRDRKIFSVCYCPVAPLVHEAAMSEACMGLGKYHVPVLVYPMPATGSTGPASLFSNVCLGNAEGLSGLVLFQLANPGCPVIFGDASGPIDFASGLFLEGAPEMVLMTQAKHELARFYGLPSTSAGCLTEAKAPGPQAIMEKMLTTMPLVMAGVDAVQGIGLVETSQVLYLEQIVIDNEIMRLCRRVKEGIDSSPEKDYISDIAAVGPGGHFLKAKSTRKAGRSGEFYRSDILHRGSHEEWERLGSPDIYDTAREKVKVILDSPTDELLPQEIISRLEEILKAADSELTEEE